MIKLIKNVEVYSPKYLGIKDVLIANDKIAAIETSLESFENSPFVEVLDGTGQLLFPGFLDCHVHLLGGGGEGGYKTRTPEIVLSDLISGGITTVVGCLGTDGITRQMESLVAKAKGLTEEGISAYVYTGSYRIPVKPLTDSIQKDLLMVSEVIGVGEVAISDHRSSAPTIEEFARLAADSRVGGILSGKAGVVNVHLGDGKEMLDYLFYMKQNSEIPLTQFLPTHANRNRELFNEAVLYGKEGGYIDFTTSTVPKFLEEGEVRASEAFKIATEKGVSSNHITFSSDGQGSLPLFDDNGVLKGLDVGKATSLYQSVIELVRDFGMSFEEALKPVTINPAKLLKLREKGSIAIGYDADLVVVDAQTYAIRTVLAKGKVMLKDDVWIKKGTFEK